METIEQAREGLAKHPNRGPHRKFYQVGVLCRSGYPAEVLKPLSCDELDILLDGLVDYPVGAHIVEAECSRCGEHFNPGGSDDMIHALNENEEWCGGAGFLLGMWATS